MLVGGVIQHEVQNDADTAPVGFPQEDFEVLQRAILRCDIGVIRNIIATIPVGGGEVRREPDGIDAELGEVIQLFRHAFEIADAIPVPVGEGARIDLIENSSLPPFEFCLHQFPFVENR